MNSTNIDFIIRIKNGYMAAKPSVTTVYSKLNENIAGILKKEGYIQDFAVVEDGNKRSITVDLLYKHEAPAVSEVKVLSRPGQRQYVKADEVKSVLGGLGVSIISTTQGVMTDKQARKSKVGGEILYSIW